MVLGLSQIRLLLQVLKDSKGNYQYGDWGCVPRPEYISNTRDITGPYYLDDYGYWGPLNKSSLRYSINDKFTYKIINSYNAMDFCEIGFNTEAEAKYDCNRSFMLTFAFRTSKDAIASTTTNIGVLQITTYPDYFEKFHDLYMPMYITGGITAPCYCALSQKDNSKYLYNIQIIAQGVTIPASTMCRVFYWWC